MLFDHTVARRRSPYVRSLEQNAISHSQLVELSRSAEVPYPLLLAPIEAIKKEIRGFEKKVFYGVSKTELSLAARGDVKLADISLILKDLTRKQSLLRKHIDDENCFPAYFGNKKLSITAKALEIKKLLGYDHVRAEQLSKQATFNHFRDLLADKNVFVSMYMHNFCPQQIPPYLKFSGICIKDKKCPYIFVRAGDDDSIIEPWGRRLFTLTLLLCCMCNGKFGAVTMDGRSKDLINDEQYELAEEILMPESEIKSKSVDNLLDIEALASAYSVSPSAMTMRLFRLKNISKEDKDIYLDLLTEKYNKLISKKGGGKQPPVEKAVSQYNSPRTVKVVTDLVSSGKMSERDARHLLYYKKGDSFSLESLVQYAG